MEVKIRIDHDKNKIHVTETKDFLKDNCLLLDYTPKSFNVLEKNKNLFFLCTYTKGKDNVFGLSKAI
jgi:hypothetical protein